MAPGTLEKFLNIPVAQSMRAGFDAHDIINIVTNVIYEKMVIPTVDKIKQEMQNYIKA